MLRDPFSHTASAMRGDIYVPDPATVAAIDLFDGWRNSQRGRGQIPQYSARPWVGTPPTYEEPQAIDTAGRDERRARLDEFSRRRNEQLALD